MQQKFEKYQSYVSILNEELVPAMGCTEPIAIAYCAAILRDTLGHIPNDVTVYVSGNILKNVKSVTVPNTGGLHGIDVACAIGLIAGKSSRKLEVIADVTEQEIDFLKTYLKTHNIEIKHSNKENVLYIEIVGKYLNDTATVVIKDAHTNVSLIEKNGTVLFENNEEVLFNKKKTDKSVLSIKEIVEFANIVNIKDVEPILSRQIKYNMAIAKEGLKNNYGANIGKTIIKYSSNDDIIQYAKALAAAGSDARMNGCDMPVVINSGSGNQGITASVPVIAYSERYKCSKDLLYRALVISNLITIHIKNSIGKLSAFCGVVIAGAGCGAGIAYLDGGHEKEICHAIVNALAIISGVLCDGAKSSCAAKIASSVEAGFIGYYMYKDGNQFLSGDGIIKKGVENTIQAIGQLARVGMCETDKEIISLMIDKG